MWTNNEIEAHKVYDHCNGLKILSNPENNGIGSSNDNNLYSHLEPRFEDIDDGEHCLPDLQTKTPSSSSADCLMLIGKSNPATLRRSTKGKNVVELPNGRNFLMMEHLIPHVDAEVVDVLPNGYGRHVDEQQQYLRGSLDEQDIAMGMMQTSFNSSIKDHEYNIDLPVAKNKISIIKKYAAKLGLNDRGCFVASFLSLIVLFLLLIIIFLIITWPASHLRHKGPLRICNSPACLKAAALLISSRNSTFDPCTDFWNFACGAQLPPQTVIPPSQTAWGSVERVQMNLRTEKARLITMSSNEPNEFNSIEWKVKHFFQSCMSLEFIESDAEKPLIKIINKLGGWEVLRSFNLYSWDSHRVLRELHSRYHVNAFFHITVVPDVALPGRNIISIGPGGLGLPDRSFYQRPPDDTAVIAYLTFLRDSGQLFGASSPEAHKFSIDMFNFEKRISEITPDGKYLKNPISTNSRMVIKDLHSTSMNIPWLDILKATYSDTHLSEEMDIVLVSAQYVADIAVILSTTDRASLNNYLMWCLVREYMPYLSKRFREVIDLYQNSLMGVEKPLERWEFCAATTERFFGHLLNSMLTKKQKQLELRKRELTVKKLFAYIKHNIAKSVSMSAHYDYPARTLAMTKLKNMTIQVGTPYFLLDRKYLKLLYKDLLVQKTDFFQNIQYGVDFLRKGQEYALGSPSEESQWLHILNGNEVQYVPTINKVVLPEVFLNPPFFSPGNPDSVNLGGVGFRLAEAVIRGIAGAGLLFDANGYLVVRHSAGGSGMPLFQNAFTAASRCLRNQYEDQNIETIEVLERCSDDTTISVAALRQTLLTLEDMLSSETGVLLPTMERVDPQAIFFLSYALSFCRQENQLRRNIDRSVSYSLLNKPRLIGSLSQMPEFSYFYYCKTKSTSCGKII